MPVSFSDIEARLSEYQRQQDDVVDEYTNAKELSQKVAQQFPGSPVAKQLEALIREYEVFLKCIERESKRIINPTYTYPQEP